MPGKDKRKEMSRGPAMSGSTWTGEQGFVQHDPSSKLRKRKEDILQSMIDEDGRVDSTSPIGSIGGSRQGHCTIQEQVDGATSSHPIITTTDLGAAHLPPDTALTITAAGRKASEASSTMAISYSLYNDPQEQSSDDNLAAPASFSYYDTTARYSAAALSGTSGQGEGDTSIEAAALVPQGGTVAGATSAFSVEGNKEDLNGREAASEQERWPTTTSPPNILSYGSGIRIDPLTLLGLPQNREERQQREMEAFLLMRRHQQELEQPGGHLHANSYHDSTNTLPLHASSTTPFLRQNAISSSTTAVNSKKYVRSRSTSPAVNHFSLPSRRDPNSHRTGKTSDCEMRSSSTLPPSRLQNTNKHKQSARHRSESYSDSIKLDHRQQEHQDNDNYDDVYDDYFYDDHRSLGVHNEKKKRKRFVCSQDGADEDGESISFGLSPGKRGRVAQQLASSHGYETDILSEGVKAYRELNLRAPRVHSYRESTTNTGGTGVHFLPSHIYPHGSTGGDAVIPSRSSFSPLAASAGLRLVPTANIGLSRSLLSRLSTRLGTRFPPIGQCQTRSASTCGFVCQGSDCYHSLSNTGPLQQLIVEEHRAGFPNYASNNFNSSAVGSKVHKKSSLFTMHQDEEHGNKRLHGEEFLDDATGANMDHNTSATSGACGREVGKAVWVPPSFLFSEITRGHVDTRAEPGQILRIRQDHAFSLRPFNPTSALLQLHHDHDELIVGRYHDGCVTQRKTAERNDEKRLSSSETSSNGSTAGASNKQHLRSHTGEEKDDLGGTVETDPAAKNNSEKGKRSKILYMKEDDAVLSKYQCLVRKQIEIFEATDDDVQFTISKMSKPAALGQVGIRCVHCAVLPQYARPKAAIYFPRTLDSMYQFGQNMVKNHLAMTCKMIPALTFQKLTDLQGKRRRGRGGRERWAAGAKDLGVVEMESEGLRFGD